jgi:hypothetical protein
MATNAFEIAHFFICREFNVELATKDHCQLSKCRVVEFGIGFELRIEMEH